jgi:hypothetical protein
MRTIDLVKEFKHLYTAGTKPQVVTADTGHFLAIDGQGAPGGAEFSAAIQAVYSVAYTIKFTRKFARTLDFKVPKLEMLYFSPPNTPREQWKWRVLVRVPEQINAKDLSAAAKACQEKGLDVSGVQRLKWKEGQAVQMLHVGPYDKVGAIYEQLHAFAREQGLEAGGPAHEIYLNDPQRTAPAKLKTIVRLSAKPHRV